MFHARHLREIFGAVRDHGRFVAAWCAAFAITLVACVIFLERWTAQTNHRAQALAALGPETRVLATGSSHVFASIDPSRVRYPMMNLAAPVCSYVCVEGILEGNLRRVPNLEVLVVEYDVVPLLYDTLSAYQRDYRQLLELRPKVSAMAISRWQKYELWRDDLVQRSFFSPLFRFGKLTPEEIVRRLRGEREGEDPTIRPGFSNGPEVMPPDDDGPARVERHRRESPGLSEVERNEAALGRIVRRARDRGWKVVLMRFPHHPGYWSSQPEEWRALHRGVLERLRVRHPDLPLWDFGQLEELDDADYRNGDHVNQDAAMLVSDKFDAALARLLENAE